MDKYFDWAATSPMCSEALEAYTEAAKRFIGNPSARHSAGRDAKNFLNSIREKIADLIDCSPSEVYFTSGGTESNAIVFESLLMNPAKGEVITSRIEHASVAEFKGLLEHNGWRVETLPSKGGYVSDSDLRAALSEHTKLVEIMTVNNVTGTLQDIKTLADCVKNYALSINRKIHFHTDAVQALGKVPFSFRNLGVDSAAFSAHKFRGPRGVGLLINRDASLIALSRGGGQENGIRPGTENIPGIAAMAAALERALSDIDKKVAAASETRAAILSVFSEEPGIRILSPLDKPVSPYIIETSVTGIPSEVFVRVMDSLGYSFSAGSACSNNAKGKVDSLLGSMGIPSSVSSSAVRISFSPDTSRDDAVQMANDFRNEYRKLKGGAR